MSDEKQQLLESYLSDKQILIVDSSKSFSSMIQRTLKSAGIPGTQIKTVTDPSNAMGHVQNLKPSVIICDYDLGDYTGISFAPMLQEYWPYARERMFVLVTANSAESALIDAVEGEVDGYVLKPFSAQKLVESLHKIVKQKLSPTKYELALEVVRKLIRENDYEKALQMANASLELSPSPCMGYALKAAIHVHFGETEEALEAYDKGLDLNGAHYKCLKGKFELLDKLGAHQQAYEALQFFFNKFPFKGLMVMKAMELAVATKNYVDLASYHDTFMELQDRSAKLIQVVSDCLCEAAEFMIDNDHRDQALDFYDRAVVSSARDPDLIERIVRKLASVGEKEGVKQIFELYPTDSIGTPSYHRLNFFVACITQSASNVVEKGRQVIELGAADENVYLEIVRTYRKMERKLACENMAYEAATKYPDRREEFLLAAGIINENEMESAKAA